MTIGKYTIKWGYLVCDNANFTIGTLSKPFSKTALQSFANYDYTDSKKKVAVSLDGSSDTEYNHVEIMPVLQDNYHQRFYIGQWGMDAANYIQINYLSGGTTNFTVEHNSSNLNRIYGVKING